MKKEENVTGFNSSTKPKEVTITGLTQGTTYAIEAIAEDYAGLSTSSTDASVQFPPEKQNAGEPDTSVSTKPVKLDQPLITFSGDKSGNWYTGTDVTATVTEANNQSTSTNMKYKISAPGWTNAESTPTSWAGERPRSATFKVAPAQSIYDGTHTVEAWVIDDWGHESTHAQEQVQVDTVNPEVTGVTQITQDTPTRLEVKVIATDATSGVASVIVSAKSGAQVVSSGSITSYKTGQNNTCYIDGLTPGTTYTITAVATDGAGHQSNDSFSTNGVTMKTGSKLAHPQISFKQKSTTGNSLTDKNSAGWYSGPLTVTITDTLSGSTATKISYQIDTQTKQTRTISSSDRSITFDIEATHNSSTNNGSHTIKAWTGDAGGDIETPAVADCMIDTQDPKAPAVVLKEGTQTKTGFTITLSNIADEGEPGTYSGIQTCTVTVKEGSTNKGTFTKSTNGDLEIPGLSAGKTYTVSAESKDNVGHVTKGTDVQIKTSDNLGAPAVDVLSIPSSGWLNGPQIQIKFTDSIKENSSANQIKYTITKKSGGAVEQNEKTLDITPGGEKTDTITATDANFQGEFIITAKACNGTASSGETKKEFKRDTVAPTVEVEQVGDSTEDTITVKPKVTEATSGIKSVTVEYRKQTDSSWTAKDGKDNTDLEINGLEDDTTYEIRAKATDNAGNNGKDSETITITTESASLIGKYVNYNPEYGEYTSLQQYNGYLDQEFKTESDMGWRIYKIDDETLTLISDRPTNTGGDRRGRLYLKGALGYDNAVMELNDICEKCYSNTKLNAKGRSMTIQDIESVTTFNYKDYSGSKGKFGGASTTYTSSKSYAPKIFDLLDSKWDWDAGSNSPSVDNRSREPEVGSSTELDENGKFRSDSPETDSSRKFTQTYWDNSYGSSSPMWDNPKYQELVIYKNDYYDDYWLASRCVHLNSDYCYFCVSVVYWGSVNAGRLYYSSDLTYGCGGAVRPLVSIPVHSVRLTASETQGMDYDIEAIY